MPAFPTDRRSAYEILDQIGTGAFSTVYKSIRKSDGKLVAVKVVDLTMMDRAGIDNVLNEIRILSSVSNPYIVEYHEAFIDPSESYFWIVMEYLGGGDLANAIKRGQKEGVRVNERQIWCYMVQLLKGVTELHKLKIIHRDIKPANIFLTDDFKRVKIGDLNVSKILKEDLAKTQIGTPYYLAPEIWNMKVYDYRADIFSLGALLYELAALKHPHEARTSHELHYKLMNEAIERIPSVYSDELNTIIHKCLVKEQILRPTAEQLRNTGIVKTKICEFLIDEEISDKDGGNLLADTIVLPKKLSLLNKKLPQKGSRASLVKNHKGDGNNITNELTNDSIKSQKTAKGVVRDLVKKKTLNNKIKEPVINIRKSSKEPLTTKPSNNMKERISSKAILTKRDSSTSKKLTSDKSRQKLSLEKPKIKPANSIKKLPTFGNPSKRPPLPPNLPNPKTQDTNTLTKFMSEKPAENRPLVSDRANPPLKMPRNLSKVFIKNVTEEKSDKAMVRRVSNQSLPKSSPRPGNCGNGRGLGVSREVGYADYLKKMVDRELSPKKRGSGVGERRSSANRSCV